jgi:hypothetical protein
MSNALCSMASIVCDCSSNIPSTSTAAVHGQAAHRTRRRCERANTRSPNICCNGAPGRLTSTHRVTALLRDNPALIDARDDEGRPLVFYFNPEAPAPH